MQIEKNYSDNWSRSSRNFSESIDAASRKLSWFKSCLLSHMQRKKTQPVTFTTTLKLLISILAPSRGSKGSKMWVTRGRASGIPFENFWNAVSKYLLLRLLLIRQILKIPPQIWNGPSNTQTTKEIWFCFFPKLLLRFHKFHSISEHFMFHFPIATPAFYVLKLNRSKKVKILN